MMYCGNRNIGGEDACMEYIAHKNGERVQTVKEHLYGTAELEKIDTL